MHRRRQLASGKLPLVSLIDVIQFSMKQTKLYITEIYLIFLFMWKRFTSTGLHYYIGVNYWLNLNSNWLKIILIRCQADVGCALRLTKVIFLGEFPCREWSSRSQLGTERALVTMTCLRFLHIMIWCCVCICKSECHNIHGHGTYYVQVSRASYTALCTYVSSYTGQILHLRYSYFLYACSFPMQVRMPLIWYIGNLYTYYSSNSFPCILIL